MREGGKNCRGLLLSASNAVSFYKLQRGGYKQMKGALIRVFRAAVAGALGVVVSEVAASPYALVLAPLLQGAGKYLRNKYGWSWLPF